MVTYFEIDNVPGKYFACTRYGTLSVNSCSKNYCSASKPENAIRLAGCLGCTVGQVHTGENKKKEDILPTIIYRPACVRCHRTGRESNDRIVGKMRLIRGHTICVSCYNREREVIHGANSKGAKPKKWSGLFFPEIAIVLDNKIIKKKMETPVVDRIEAMFTVIRQSANAAMFFPNTPPILRA